MVSSTEQLQRHSYPQHSRQAPSKQQPRATCFMFRLSTDCKHYIYIYIRRKRRSKRICKPRNAQPRYRRPALLTPLSSRKTTPWKQLISCGSSTDFLISMNVDRHTFFNLLLPFVINELPKLNFGSPYRRQLKTKGRRCTFLALDILGMVLWLLKFSGRQYTLCPIFGIKPTSLAVWLDYGLELMLQIC